MTMLDCYETIKRVRWATFDVKVLRVPLLIIFSPPLRAPDPSPPSPPSPPLRTPDPSPPSEKQQIALVFCSRKGCGRRLISVCTAYCNALCCGIVPWLKEGLTCLTRPLSQCSFGALAALQIQTREPVLDGRHPVICEALVARRLSICNGLSGHRPLHILGLPLPPGLPP